MVRLSVFICCVLHFTFLKSQVSSSYNQLKTAKELTRKNPDSSNYLLNQVMVKFETLPDSIKAQYVSIRGNYYFFSAEYDSALWYYKQNLSGIYLDSDHIKAKMANNIGIIYNYTGKQDSAYKYLTLAYQLKRKVDDPSIGGTLNNLGLVSERLGLLEEAIDYYRQGIVLKRENGQLSSLGTSYLNLGVAWRHLQNYDSAIYYGSIAKDNFEQQDDKKGQADALNNLALNYFDKSQVDLAFSYARQSLEIKRKLGDEYGMMNTYQNLSIYLMSGGDFTQARMYSDSSIYLAQKNSASAQERNAYLHIARIDSARGDFLEAFEWMKKAYRLQYEIYDSEVTNRITELETQYETAQKEQEIKRLSQENEIIQLRAEQNEQERLILVLSLLFLIVIIVAIFSFYRSKEKSNKQLMDANHQLANLNQTKDRLFSIISHDLKSPLSSFHLITKSLTDNWDNLEKDQLKDFLVTLRDSSANVRDMMDNLLKWALAQTDQLQYSPELVDPAEIISAVKNQLIPVAQLKKMEIQVNQQETLNIHADKAFLEIVIRNLVSNAVKYSDVHKKVEVSVNVNEDRGVITIQDEGVGMDQSQIDSLLNGSLIAHDIQNSPEKGTGLGLLLCKELVARMNGQLEVRSKINEGTTFRISFPKAA